MNIITKFVSDVGSNLFVGKLGQRTLSTVGSCTWTPKGVEERIKNKGSLASRIEISITRINSQITRETSEKEVVLWPPAGGAPDNTGAVCILCGGHQKPASRNMDRMLRLRIMGTQRIHKQHICFVNDRN
ncbi:uncharacterized protein LOC143150930 [Ptiloglossa arizonensis]|uniref:uncharacterized protein LOC143150930 n=1 Tax=Ptiloglossa arizonensis TaxID=3350558 RepID=UPI003FA12000